MQNGVTEYEVYERRSGSLYNRKCIDGKITGCSNCVGYCKFCEHPGFLTQKQREQHDCLRKDCKYYVPRERTKSLKPLKDSKPDVLLHIAEDCVNKTDDIRIMGTHYSGEEWVISYITVFGVPNIKLIENSVSKNTGMNVRFQKLNYSFERCAELLCAK